MMPICPVFICPTEQCSSAKSHESKLQTTARLKESSVGLACNGYNSVALTEIDANEISYSTREH